MHGIRAEFADNGGDDHICPDQRAVRTNISLLQRIAFDLSADKAAELLHIGLQIFGVCDIRPFKLRKFLTFSTQNPFEHGIHRHIVFIELIGKPFILDNGNTKPEACSNTLWNSASSKESCFALA